VIVVKPSAIDVAKPTDSKSISLLMVATGVDDELQVTNSVTSCTELSEKVPDAANCCVKPLGMLESNGVIAMDRIVADVTVSVVLPDTLVAGSVAVMVVEPGVIDVAKPAKPETISLLMSATDVSDELQIIKSVTSWVVLSE
jgi:hypothetical protein